MSSCYTPNPNNLNFKYISSIGLIIGDDGCGGCIFIPSSTFLRSTGLISNDVISSVGLGGSDSMLARFSGSQIMFNNSSRREEFAAWSADPPPHALRMTTLYNLPLDALERARWNNVGIDGKSLSFTDDIDDIVKGIVFITSNALPYAGDSAFTFSADSSALYPILRLDRARWEAVRPYATELTP